MGRVAWILLVRIGFHTPDCSASGFPACCGTSYTQPGEPSKKNYQIVGWWPYHPLPQGCPKTTNSQNLPKTFHNPRTNHTPIFKNKKQPPLNLNPLPQTFATPPHRYPPGPRTPGATAACAATLHRAGGVLGHVGAGAAPAKRSPEIVGSAGVAF